MSFATTEQLATLLDKTFTTGENAQADLALMFATAAIIAEVGQSIDLIETTAKLAGTWARDLILPERPATAVATVALNGVALGVGDWYWNGAQVLRRGQPFGPASWADYEIELDTTGDHVPQGAVGFSPLGWGGPDTIVAVKYTHGVEPTPDLIVGVCLAAAGRFMLSPIEVRQEMLGAYQVTYAAGGIIELGESERRLLRKAYRKRAHAG